MCAQKHDQVSQNVPEVSATAGDAEKHARIAQLEADIARLKRIRQSRDAHNAKYASARLEHEDLQRFIDINILPIFRADIWGHIYEVNDAMVRLLGYTRDEFLSGRVRWTTITPPEYSDMDADAVEQLKQTGKTKPWEKVYIAKDGTRKSLLIGAASADETGEDVLCFVVDRTEETRLQEEIRASERKFRALAEAMPCIVWLTDPSGKTVYHNKRFIEYTGIKETSNGYDWLDAVHPDDKKIFASKYDDAKQKGLPLEAEFRFRSANGDYRWHLARGIPLHDEKGEMQIFGTTIDIDAEKQLEEELRESELRFRTLANAIPQIVWTAEPDGTITFFNDRWFEYTGLTYQQSCENGWQLLIHPDDLQSYVDGWHHALTTGDSYEIEFRIKRAAGLGKRLKDPYRWHLCRAVALRDNAGSIVKWFATWTEIEDQKRKR